MEGLSGEESNAWSNGDRVPVFPLSGTTCNRLDPPHEWSSSRIQWNGGANDGYLRAVEEHYPGTADRGRGASPSPQGDPTYGFDFRTIYESMSDQGIDWRVYFTDAPSTMLYRWPRLNHPERFTPMAKFYADAAAGDLASFTTIDPAYFSASDHAPQNAQLGQLFIASVYYALAASPAWERTALVVTYDEDGGFYDHVPHLRGLADERQNLADLDHDFSKSGGRVPTMVLGPWARQGEVCHTQMDHTSILALAQECFGLGSLTERDAARRAAGQHMLDCFDFDGAPRDPVVLPVPSFHASMFTDCASTYLGPPAPYVPGPRDATNPSLDLNDLLAYSVAKKAIPMLSATATRRTLTRAFRMAEAAAASGPIGSKLRL